MNELALIFPNLQINKIKAKKGRKIEWLEFTFEPEKRIHSKKAPETSKPHHYKNSHINREKTPKWLAYRDLNNDYMKDKTDEQLEADRKAFQEQLQKDWED